MKVPKKIAQNLERWCKGAIARKRLNRIKINKMMEIGSK
jgi:hypothetical protein